MEVGFLVHWESLLSTIGDEAGMLDDFMTAIYDANNMHFQVRKKECHNSKDGRGEDGGGGRGGEGWRYVWYSVVGMIIPR